MIQLSSKFIDPNYLFNQKDVKIDSKLFSQPTYFFYPNSIHSNLTWDT